MATLNRKKMTRLRRASSAQKITTKWKPFRPQIDTLAIGVEESMLSEKAKFKTLGLKALNDIYIIEEDPIDYERDKASGLTGEVVDSIKQGTLVIPETAEFYAKKYPCTGKVLAHGDKCKYNVEPGTRITFGRGGILREQIDGKDYVFMREADILAILS